MTITLGKRESQIGFIGFSYRLSRKVAKVREQEKCESDAPDESDFFN